MHERVRIHIYSYIIKERIFHLHIEYKSYSFSSLLSSENDCVFSLSQRWKIICKSIQTKFPMWFSFFIGGPLCGVVASKARSFEGNSAREISDKFGREEDGENPRSTGTELRKCAPRNATTTSTRRLAFVSSFKEIPE